jgi:predicted ribonuclease YlaK
VSGEAVGIRISSPEDNAAKVLRLLEEIRALVAQAQDFVEPLRYTRVVDTSALMDCPRPREYGPGEFSFVIPRAVLRELDELRHHEQEAKRKMARRALNHIREWDRRGSLLEGVREDRSIRVRALGHEADMSDAPRDLAGSKPDDRIIWTARQLTFQQPLAVVVLVSGDSNLRTRAALAFVETEPAPPPV